MILNRVKLRRRIAMGLLSACALAPFAGHTAYAAEDDDVYDFGTVDVIEEKAVETPVEEPAPPEEEKNAYAGGQVAETVQVGVLGDMKALDAPFNITGFTEQTIKDSQVSLMADLIANDPSVSNQTLSGVSSAWNIRGFKAQQQDVQLNGLYGVAPRFYGGIESAERVDILKGPSVLLAGIAPNGSLGGTINFITKKAGKEPLNRLTLSYGDGSVFTQQFDFARRTDDGKAGVRVNVLNRNGDTSFDEGNRTASLAIGADYKGDRYRIDFDYGKVYNKVSDQQYQVTVGANVRKVWNSMVKMPRDSKFGADGGYRTVHEDYGMIHGEYDLSKATTAYASFGLRTTEQTTLFNNFQLNNVNGSVSNRYRYNNQINKVQSAEVGIRTKAKTGILNHELTFAANRIHYTRWMSQRNVGSLGATNLWNIHMTMPNNPYTFEAPKNDSNTFSGFSIVDTIKTADDRWTFVAGGRKQNVVVDTYDNALTSTKASHYAESAFLPSFALVYKPAKNSSIYANYMEGLNADDALVSDTAAANYGQAFAPFRTKQYEVGVKYDFGKWATTLDYFSIKSPSLIADSANYYAPTGEIRHRGVEWNFFGEPVKGTRILGGIMYLDAKYTKSQNGQYDGNRVPATSKWSAVLGLEHDVRGVEGLTLTTRLTYNSDAYINEANDFRVSPWTTWDIGARYKFTSGKTPMTLRADVYNVTNRNYWRALTSNGVFLGKSRTFMLSLSMDL